jgi:hypothetical protein
MPSGLFSERLGLVLHVGEFVHVREVERPRPEDLNYFMASTGSSHTLWRLLASGARL